MAVMEPEIRGQIMAAAVVAERLLLAAMVATQLAVMAATVLPPLLAAVL
jgi:hypothetical protein